MRVPRRAISLAALRSAVLAALRSAVLAGALAAALAACGGAESAEPAAPAPAAPARPAAATAATTGAPATGAPAAAAAPHRCAASVPSAACTAPGLRACERGAADRVGEWRYALVAGPFEPTPDVTAARLTAAWRGGAIAAAPETEAALAAALGPRGAGPRLGPGERPQPDGARWAIVPAHELSPSFGVITVDGRHPLEATPQATEGPLVLPVCGAAPAPIRNIDPARLTRLVMSGTTALTGRTAERIDNAGITEMIRHLRPFFREAELVHISNEVSFVRRCKPMTGQDTLKFCARDRYIALLEGLNTRLVELTGSHLIDYGHAALVRTIDEYARRGWIWFGGGKTQLDATAPRIVEDHGNRLAFVGCNAVAAWIRAIGPGPGVATCHWARMIWQIQDLRRRGYTPIATVQHRELRTHAPPPDLVRDLRSLAEAGAMFVLGSQAHVAHPWDVHRGAYIHYGPGNTLFAQHREMQRDAAIDKLYIHDGRLLTVAHLFLRTEHGQPRLQTEAERASFLGELAAAAAQIEPPDPWTAPVIPPEPRARPDSLIVAGRSQRLTVTVPERVAPDVRYPLLVDLSGAAPAADRAFVAVPIGDRRAKASEIAAFMREKYPIDPAQVTIVPGAEPKPKPATRRHPRRLAGKR
ncbi:MAG TPA: CapA family protein [Kofleriaceae bacterium]|nr:CapA family protein [Kofleriaceae bacterium]